MDLAYLLTYLSIALLVWYMISEVFKAQPGKHRMAAIAFVGIVLAFVAWYVWTVYKQEHPKKNYVSNKGVTDQEEPDASESESEDVIDERDRVFVQRKYKARKVSLSIASGKSKKTVATKYRDFKKKYLTPKFLSKFTDAINVGLDIQKTRIGEYAQVVMKKIKKLESGKKPGDGLSGLVQRLTDKNDELDMLKSSLERCQKLYKVIERRKNANSVDRTRRNLINALTNPRKGLDSIIGREDIKDFMALQLKTFSKNPRVFLSNFQNAILKGPSGIGKTKLAEVIGYVYGTSGITLNRDVGKYTKTAITTAYVDESAKMTKKLFLSYLGSVIFFDEAYSIATPKNTFGTTTGHGGDAIAEMLEFMNDTKGLTIVLAAGYKKEMEERFEGNNEGILRRFPNRYILDYYNSNELTMILLSFIKKTCPEIEISKESGNYIYTLVDYINKRDQDYDPEDRIFRTQAGAMESLSSHITSAIYGTRGKKWPRDSDYIILTGVNSFLAPHNISIKLDDVL